MSAERSKYLSMYYKADFRAVNMDDHLQAGNASNRFLNNRGGHLGGFFNRFLRELWAVGSNDANECIYTYST